MVNQQPDGFDHQQWYPQLPEGYEGYERQQRQHMPSHGQGGWQPWMQGMPGFGGQSPGMTPGHGGMPGHGPPPFGPPGHQPGWGRPPGQQPGNPPRNPGQQGQQGPTSAPPNFTPEYPEAQLFRVDPGAIRGCLYRYTFVWLSRRQGFWFYPTFVGRTSVAGYRWRRRRRRWEYFGIDLNNIDSFTCF